jgi:hypothetical protein
MQHQCETAALAAVLLARRLHPITQSATLQYETSRAEVSINNNSSNNSIHGNVSDRNRVWRHQVE